jgi:hypothetical protein
MTPSGKGIQALHDGGAVIATSRIRLNQKEMWTLQLFTAFGTVSVTVCA